MNTALWTAFSDETKYTAPPDPEEPPSHDGLTVAALVCVAIILVVWLITKSGMW